jgi:hypothetical protein
VEHQHSLDHIRSVLERVGFKLDKPITAYHIGGNAMCWHGLKNSTKDADIVFLMKKEAEAFRKALLASKFIENEIVSLDDGYIDMNTFGIFDEIKETPLNEEFTPGLRVDVFLKRVCGVFEFSEGMRKRSVKGFESGKITNMVCAPEDVFLFKSITSREKDIEDMYSIFKGGIDFQIVGDEFRYQTSNMGSKRALGYSKVVSGRWKVFYNRFGIKLPIKPISIKKR